MDDDGYELALHSVFEWGDPAALVANRGCSPDTYHPTQKISKVFLAERPIHRDHWTGVKENHAFSSYVSRCAFDPGLVKDYNPHILAGRASRYNEDNPSWDMVMWVHLRRITGA